jgi:sugar phosphate permease
MDKVTWRLLPFLIVCYFIAFLDRLNIGFANAAMSKDLALSAAAFGGAAGIFYIGYFFFEVPSNLALNKFGARVWIARIMFTSGIISGAQAFVVGETSLNIVRLLLGVAETGFFPGIIFFLTLWFPSAYRARIIGCGPGLDCGRLADIGFHSRHGGSRRPQWLAVDVFDRGGPGAAHGSCGPLLFDRSTGVGDLA